ncbi:DRXIA protein, partial [Polyodon spathula]|nr:DRXIA protein [Polyodon spathula]
PAVFPADKRRSKTLSSRNETLEGEAEAEPCDHHLDCLPGSCCDLRQHVCKPHNHGLNNKCFDNCMCEEGESQAAQTWHSFVDVHRSL